MLTTLIALVATASSAAAAQVCAPGGCLDGYGTSKLLAYDESKETYYTPGAFSGNQSPTPQVEAVVDAGVSASTINGPSLPLAFSSHFYDGEATPLNKSNTFNDQWHSLFLPPRWFAVLSNGVALWGAIPDRFQFSPLDPTEGTLQVESSVCTPACTTHGTCVPNTRNNNGTCTCDSGWAGNICETCADGYFGPSCQACPKNCATCDDGIFGTGACTATAVVKDCNCDHGSCLPSGECLCAGGYVTEPSVSTKQCNACGDGYFEDFDQSCMPCPVGCATCYLDDAAAAIMMPTVVCTACAGSTELRPQDGGAACQSTVPCEDGQYWDRDENSCQPCSSTCLKCYGPQANECTDCRLKAVLDGVCVSFDEFTGKCETRGEGTMLYMGDNDSRGGPVCEPCPVGCMDCHASSSTKVCTACHDGFVLSGDACLKSCPSNQFVAPTGANGTCTDCASSCKTCTGDSTFCTSCHSGSAYNGSCISACPDGTLEVDGRCAACHPDCATCSAPGAADKCTTCPPSRPVYEVGRCIRHCPRGSFFHATDDVLGGKNINGTACGRCDKSCDTCISGNGCTSCPDNHRLVGGRCEAANCTGPFVESLGTCLSSVVDLRHRDPPVASMAAGTTSSKSDDNKRYYPLIALAIIPILAGVGFFLFTRRERRKTRDATAEFGRQLAEVDINKRLQQLDAEANDLLPMAQVRPARENSKKTANDSEFAAYYEGGAHVAAPPAYTPRASFTSSSDVKQPAMRGTNPFTTVPLSPAGSRQSFTYDNQKARQQTGATSTTQPSSEDIWADLYDLKPTNAGRQNGAGWV